MSNETKHTPTVDANARLIAAAPDLLEALRECASALSAYTDTSAPRGEDPIADDIVKILEKADAAIAKAQGEQS